MSLSSGVTRPSSESILLSNWITPINKPAIIPNIRYNIYRSRDSNPDSWFLRPVSLPVRVLRQIGERPAGAEIPGYLSPMRTVTSPSHHLKACILIAAWPCSYHVRVMPSQCIDYCHCPMPEVGFEPTKIPSARKGLRVPLPPLRLKGPVETIAGGRFPLRTEIMITKSCDPLLEALA